MTSDLDSSQHNCEESCGIASGPHLALQNEGVLMNRVHDAGVGVKRD